MISISFPGILSSLEAKGEFLGTRLILVVDTRVFNRLSFPRDLHTKVNPEGF